MLKFKKKVFGFFFRPKRYRKLINETCVDAFLIRNMLSMVVHAL